MILIGLGSGQIVTHLAFVFKKTVRDAKSPKIPIQTFPPSDFLYLSFKLYRTVQIITKCRWRWFCMVQDTKQQVVTLSELASLLAVKSLVQSRAIAAKQGAAMFMSFLQDVALSFIGPFKTFFLVCP